MTRRDFQRVALALFGAIGLYVAAIFALFAAGFVTGLVVHRRAPSPSPRLSKATPAVRYFVDRPTNAAAPSGAAAPEPSR